MTKTFKMKMLRLIPSNLLAHYPGSLEKSEIDAAGEKSLPSRNDFIYQIKALTRSMKNDPDSYNLHLTYFLI